jgi:predicted dehydrogenase
MTNQSKRTRRQFLQQSALTGAGMTMLGGLKPGRVLGANDRIRLGVLGSGGRAQYLMKLFKEHPEVELVAVCDVYSPKRQKAREIAGERAKEYLDYREVLDRKDIDAVLIGSPDHWHKPMLIDSVHAGKDVYLEKPIMHSIEEGVEMVRAVEETKRIVQTGTQQRSWEHYILGKQIMDSGKLGKIILVHTYWYQNYQPWFAKLPDVDTSQLDWKRFLGSAPEQPFRPERLFLWRHYWDFGGGILADLLTHWMDVIQWYMGQSAPLTATTTAQTYMYSWEAPDSIAAAFEFPGDFIVCFTGAYNNGSAEEGGIEFRGSQATLVVTRRHLAVYREGAAFAPGAPLPEPEIHVRSARDGTVDNVQNFLDCLRSRKMPNAHIRAGFEAARTAWIGNIALRRGTKVVWDAAQGRVAS